MTILERASGILVHVTSLPSDFGIGDLGPSSYRFVDLLSQTNQGYWHILPLTPTTIQNGNSPYQSTSAFAGNTLLISPELLVKECLLSGQNGDTLTLPAGRVDFEAVTAAKKAMIKKAYCNFKRGLGEISRRGFEKFCTENSDWLNDYALYAALMDKAEKPWYLWPKLLRDRNPDALKRKELELQDLVKLEKFAQFVFFAQLNALVNCCRVKKVSLIGDLPFYVSDDSADVWVHPELFKLNGHKHPGFVGGVPPDYFSQTGQRWGNPVYDWREMKKTAFGWWMKRASHTLRLVDILRLDHFRGYTAYWQIPAAAKTAKKGRWIKTPSKSFFSALKQNFPKLPFIAEDLGRVTEAVRQNLKCTRIPGMRVLIFAFDDSEVNPNLPKNQIYNSAVFTGTHDTNTVRGWFCDEASKEQKNRVFKTLGKRVSEEEIHIEFVKLALKSKAKLCLLALQDILGLGSEARMNYPSRLLHNWEWRVSEGQFEENKIAWLAELTKDTGRV